MGKQTFVRQYRAEDDKALGLRIRQFREVERVSQDELAALLTEAGMPWTQSAVYRTENGLRPLRFSEAVVLAKVLRVTLPQLAGMVDGPGEATGHYARILELRRTQREIAARERQLFKEMNAESASKGLNN